MKTTAIQDAMQEARILADRLDGANADREEQRQFKAIMLLLEVADVFLSVRNEVGE